MMARAYLGLGSNINRALNISSALVALRRELGELRVSTVYEVPAVGFEGAAFYNLAVGLSTDLPPGELNRAVHAIEDRHGRDRSAPRYSDRTLDIDLLLYGDLVMNESELRLPRPEILTQAFVLRPLAEIAPDYIHPLEGRRLGELWAELQPRATPMTPVELGPGPG